jgi:hypothetical protein
MLAIRSDGIAIGTHDGECACVSRGDGFGGLMQLADVQPLDRRKGSSPRGRANEERRQRAPAGAGYLVRRGPQKSPAGQTSGANANRGLVIRGRMTKPKHYTQVLHFVINQLLGFS